MAPAAAIASKTTTSDNETVTAQSTPSSSSPEKKSPENKNDHERGTPRSAARYPHTILFCLWIFSTAVSSWSFLSYSSSLRSNVRTIVNCGLGAASSFCGIYFTDTVNHIATLLIALVVAFLSPPLDIPTTTSPLLLSPSVTLILLLLLQKFNKNAPLLPPFPLTSILPYTLPLLVVFQSTSPTLTSANTATLLVTYLSVIATSLHVTTSGQFRMVCLDALGMIFYVGAPLLILQHYLWDEIISVSPPSVSAALVTFLSRVTVQGGTVTILLHSVVLILITRVLNATLPLSAHLLGVTYTHGQRHTDHLAVTCHMNDIRPTQTSHQHSLNFDAAASEQEFKLLLRDLEHYGAGLTVFCSLSDMYDFKEKINRLKEKGCLIGLLIEDEMWMPSEVENEGEEWRWFRCVGRNPFVVRWGCHTKKMKMCLWSFQGESISDIERHVSDRNGGCVVNIRSISAIREAVKHYGKKLKTLNEVCLDDIYFDLKKR